MSWLDSSTLFKLASGVYAISAPGHVMLGFQEVYPALRAIPRTGKHAIGQRGAENCWNYVVASLTVASVMNWQWARYGGPQTREESLVFWIIAGMHAVNGLRYMQVGCYPALAPMWLAPILSVVALNKA